MGRGRGEEVSSVLQRGGGGNLVLRAISSFFGSVVSWEGPRSW